MHVQVSGLVDLCLQLGQILLCSVATCEKCFWVRQAHAVVDATIGGITTDAAGLNNASMRKLCSWAPTANCAAMMPVKLHADDSISPFEICFTPMM